KTVLSRARKAGWAFLVSLREGPCWKGGHPWWLWACVGQFAGREHHEGIYHNEGQTHIAKPLWASCLGGYFKQQLRSCWVESASQVVVGCDPVLSDHPNCPSRSDC